MLNVPKLVKPLGRKRRYMLH